MRELAREMLVGRGGGECKLGGSRERTRVEMCGWGAVGAELRSNRRGATTAGTAQCAGGGAVRDSECGAARRAHGTRHQLRRYWTEVTYRRNCAPINGDAPCCAIARFSRRTTLTRVRVRVRV